MKWPLLLLAAVLLTDIALSAVASYRTYSERTSPFRIRAKRQMYMPMPYPPVYGMVVPGFGFENMDMNMNQFGGVSVGGMSYTSSIG